MAARNLRGAAEVVARHPEEAARFGVDLEEAASWRDAANGMVIPYDEKLGVHPQAEGFTEHAIWNFAATPPEHYPLMLHYPYFDLYRKQVVKQADLVLAMQLCPLEFDADQKARNFAYYEKITVRDSSLSAATQAVMAAETGHLSLAYDYLCETSQVDLGDLAKNTAHGLHIAALAGSWSAVVAGFGGMRQLDGLIAFAPRLPEALTRIALRLRWRKSRLRVVITPGRAEYQVRDGDPLELQHYDEKIQVAPGTPVIRPIPPITPKENPTQPPGREPLARRLRQAGEPS
jgi:alpha,alpha-trehalose phosphorylase